MRLIDGNNGILENIEMLLKSIDYQLGQLLQNISAPVEKEEKKEHITEFITDEKVPEMISIREASHRTGLSYDFLRKQCLKGNLAHFRIGTGKFLINYEVLIKQMNTAHGDMRKENDDGI